MDNNTYKNENYENIINYYIEFVNKNIKESKKDFISFSDTHGDLLSVMASLKRAGVLFDGVEKIKNIIIPKITDCKKNIIFIGDLLDKGPESIESLMLMKSLKEKFNNKLKFIIGNHEMAYNNITHKEANVDFSEKFTKNKAFKILSNIYDKLEVNYIVDNKYFSHTILNKKAIISSLIFLKIMKPKNKIEVIENYFNKFNIESIENFDDYLIRKKIKTKIINDNLLNKSILNTLNFNDLATLANIIGKISIKLKFDKNYKYEFINYNKHYQAYIENNIFSISTKDENFSDLKQDKYENILIIHGHDNKKEIEYKEEFNSLNIDNQRSIIYPKNNNLNQLIHNITTIEFNKNSEEIYNFNIEIENKAIEKLIDDYKKRGIVIVGYKKIKKYNYLSVYKEKEYKKIIDKI